MKSGENGAEDADGAENAGLETNSVRNWVGYKRIRSNIM